MARQSAALVLNADDRAALEQLARSGKTEQRVALRSRIVLQAAAGLSDSAIARELQTSRPTVVDWRRRWAAEGLAGLIRDRPRGRGFEALAQDQEAMIIDKTLHTKPSAGTHWSCRSMAKVVGVSKASVQRIWSAHGLKPHLVRTLELSNDPAFVEKLQDVVGLYMSPPENALVLSIDEKSQIQPAPGGRRLQPEGPMQGGIGGALDRTQPGLPLKKGRAGTMTHDYKRNGTTTLFAALDVLKGQVIGQCMKRHRHQEFLKFLRTIDRQTPEHLDLHCIVDNYATHKKQEVKDWLAKHPRFHFHFIPTSSSWLNLIERWFRDITTRRIRRGVFTSVPQLEQAIDEYIQHNNANPKPFTWTKSASQIVEKVKRCKALLETLH